MQPRIYTYKITFPEQGWWYWGVHKERKFGEEYNGSPVTHKDKWENFEYEKQILEFFEDWEEACSVENRLIKPDLNNPMCLNENCGPCFSIETSSKGGQIGGKIAGKITGKKLGDYNVRSGHLERILTQEVRSMGGKVMGARHAASGHMARVQNRQYRCLVTGSIMNAGNLSQYQRKQGIDTSLRELVQ